MGNFDKFRDIVNSPHSFVKNWKAMTGGKVLGYLCTNLPEELVYAAGVLPVRLLGSNEPESVTSPYLFQAALCSFSRDCFAQCLKAKYDYIDGIIYGLCCMHTRQVFQEWQKVVPAIFTYELQMPALMQNPLAKRYLIGEIRDFKSALEKWIGHYISNNDLDIAIDLYNTNRRLMLSIYALMEADDPPIGGEDVIQMALAGMLIDKQIHNQLLQEALVELSTMKGTGKHGPRLMLLGSVNTDLGLIKLIENCGARIVIDDYCTGNRYYQTQVISEGNQLAALATRLIEQPPCPLKDLSSERHRVKHISKLIHDYNVEGVIYTIQRQCDSHGLDYPSIKSAVNNKDIPMLKLELDYPVLTGQYRTRIEAFVEMLSTS